MNNRGVFSTGNALRDGHSGWFVGQFMPESMGISRQEHVELKWGSHPKGECRRGFSEGATATTISLLISGAFITRLVIDGEVREFRLHRPGDFIVYGPGLAHSWEALEDSLVITVRFPSVAGDFVERSSN